MAVRFLVGVVKRAGARSRYGPDRAAARAAGQRSNRGASRRGYAHPLDGIHAAFVLDVLVMCPVMMGKRGARRC